MKRKSSIFIVLLAIIVDSFIVFWGYKHVNFNSSTSIYISGDFKYVKVKGGIKLYGLSYEGDQKEAIIIPEKIDEYTVTGIYISRKGSQISYFNNHKFFVNFQVDNKERYYYYFSSAKWETTMDSLGKENIQYTGSKVFIYNENQLKRCQDKYLFYPAPLDFKEKYNMLIKANVTYYYNNNTSDYYWIDDYDDELISYIPEDPIYEGYTFDGWYKESECINKWDFETDKVPKKEYSDNKEESIESRYIFKETKLYAKWI